MGVSKSKKVDFFGRFNGGEKSVGVGSNLEEKNGGRRKKKKKLLFSSGPMCEKRATVVKTKKHNATKGSRNLANVRRKGEAEDE